VIGPAALELEAHIPTTTACEVLGRSRATHYRRLRPAPDPAVVTQRRWAAQPRALSADEQAEVLEVLHSDRFVDESPATAWATLLDEGTYLASPATMYRLLRRAHGGVPERRRQATHPPRSRPELVAEAPNEVWSWDITRLRGPAKRQFFYLYVLLDIYSRYVPGWMLASVERAELARRGGQLASGQQLHVGLPRRHVPRHPEHQPWSGRQRGVQHQQVAARPGTDHDVTGSPVPAGHT